MYVFLWGDFRKFTESEIVYFGEFSKYFSQTFWWPFIESVLYPKDAHLWIQQILDSKYSEKYTLLFCLYSFSFAGHLYCVTYCVCRWFKLCKQIQVICKYCTILNEISYLSPTSGWMTGSWTRFTFWILKDDCIQ